MQDAVRVPRSAVALLSIVMLCFLLQIGALISQVLADTPGGSASGTVLPDSSSDTVAATAAEFRVDESGAATYSVPLYAVPGTAGVAPKLSLNYSSQGGYGPLGKGWSLGGLSSIGRCRATREAGDFISGGAPIDGTPAPINYTATDKYCLDGQRLVPAQATGAGCPAASGMTAQNLRTEIESFQRVCAYTPSSGTAGVAFFTVERKDGSISWYGDRDNNSGANRADGYFNSTTPGKEAFALSWAQTRFQDSTGNYIDFIYLENPGGAGTGEQVLSEVRYTGKTLLSGQTGSASAPYAKVMFNYSALPAAQWGKGYASGGTYTQSRRLDSITSCASAAAGCAAANQARYYQLLYASSAAGSWLDVMTSLQECRDNTKTVCMPATTFSWSAGKYEFATHELPPNLPTGSLAKFEGFKMGDVDGDGRQDIVYLKDGSSGESCATEYVFVLFATMDSNGMPTYTQGSPICTPAELMTGRGEGSWHLLDYNGDGRDDLFVSAPAGSGWQVYPSNGRNSTGNFDPANNLIVSLSPIIPSQETPNDQVQIADLNGDGLIDVVYPSNGVLKARLMERGGNGAFGWGAERSVSFDMASLGPLDPRCSQDYACDQSVEGAPTTRTNFIQLADFNGDGSSDLLMQELIQGEGPAPPGCPQPIAPPSLSQPTADSGDGGTILPYYTEQQDQAVVDYEQQLNNIVNCSGTFFFHRSLHAMAVSAITATTIKMASAAEIEGPVAVISLADANADGLTDIFYRIATNSDWVYRINTGTGWGVETALGPLSYPDKAQFVDINGDGRADVLNPVDTGADKRYMLRYGVAAGGFSSETSVPGGNAVLCEGYECDPTIKVPIFADLDGDGNLDFMSLKLADNADVLISRANTRFVPRDAITQITNGLGAQTDISYAPLTNRELYLRDSGTRDATSWGRGSAVQDFLAPTYAVSRVSSSAPQAGSPTAKASVYYRYAGAKVQAGGRGFLGFREILTIDPNETGGYVTTATAYNQDFPLVGLPLRTIKRAVLNQAYIAPTCLSGIISEFCFAPVGTQFPALPGNWFSDNSQVWESDTDIGTATVAFAPGVQAPVHVRTAGTDEKLRDPIGGAQTGRVFTMFGYGSYGNATTTSIDTFTGTSGTAMATVSTASTYIDNPTLWRLGRLTATTVTHSRPGKASVVRTTSFGYAMAGAATGLLTFERAQPGGSVDQDLRKEYTLDDYGNRTISVACADPATACSSAILFHPKSATTIQRYGRVAYDSRGRYPLASYELFWSGTAGVEMPTQTVVARNVFGDVTQAYDVNGRDTFAVAGTFGRAYYAWSESIPGSVPGTPAGGVDSTTTYRWCGPGTGQVSCPTGAVFRQQVVTDGAPRQWSYFDVLGRPLMKAAETFNVGVGGKDVAATCSTYDATGKPKQSSNPFFVAGTSGSNGPTGLGAACSSAALMWTTTYYDVLGRPTDVVAADTSVTSSDYVGASTILTDARGNATTQVRNGKGELTTAIDANGLALTYTYQADGAMTLVSRNAGRGAISNAFTYDAMGRKIRQDDPDSGTTTFEYNALGELIAQNRNDLIGPIRIENQMDARGRAWQRTVSRTTSQGATVESTSGYVFDTAANGMGQLASESISGKYLGGFVTGTVGSALNYARSYSYDALGRPLGSITGIDGINYRAAVSYDSLGRPWKAQDVSGNWVKTAFNARGLAESVCNSSATDAVGTCPATTETYLRTLEADAWGHALKERRGNSTAMDVNHTYASDTGRVSRICAGTAAGCGLMNEGYTWDAAGNLASQQKEGRYAEKFTYDSLNRLVRANLLVGATIGAVTQAYEYDALGNICSKTALGTAATVYTYLGRSGCGLGGTMNSPYGSGGTSTFGPHQVVNVGTAAYSYDERGNQTVKDAPSSTFDRTIKYTLDDKAYQIAVTGGGAYTQFWYGSDGQRYKRMDGRKRTLYLGNVEIVTEGALTTYRRTIAGAMLQTVVGTTKTTYYLFHDQLGNLIKVTNATGTVLNSQDYAAFGARRDYNDLNAAGTSVPTVTTRGFTGHEMVDGVLGVIHMNGRIFDSGLGRFLQVDPVIQAPYNAQSWNAYTYCFNNPYTYTDPTGMIGQSERMWLGAIVAIVATIFAPEGAGFWYAAFVGAVAGGISTGSWQGALYGAFSASLFYGVGSYFQAQGMANSFDDMMGNSVNTVGTTGLSWGQLSAKILAHGVAGGVMSRLQGGNFGNGFASAGFAEAAAPEIGNINSSAGKGVATVVVGGTASRMSGGKFANGALTAAFSYAFNELAHAPRGTGMGIGAQSDGAYSFVVTVSRMRDSGMYNYDAWVTTYDEEGNELDQAGPYPASAVPDPKQVAGGIAARSGNFTIQSGVYGATVKLGLNHYPMSKKYWALEIGTVPAASGSRNISGEWLHAGYLYSGTGSAGCITIRYTSYNAFISNFWRNEPGLVYVNHNP